MYTCEISEMPVVIGFCTLGQLQRGKGRIPAVAASLGTPSAARHRHQLWSVLLKLRRSLLDSLALVGRLNETEPCLFGG